MPSCKQAGCKSSTFLLQESGFCLACEKLKATFELFDEERRAFAQLNMKRTPDEITALINSVDDGDGLIDYLEFRELLLKKDLSGLKDNSNGGGAASTLGDKIRSRMDNAKSQTGLDVLSPREAAGALTRKKTARFSFDDDEAAGSGGQPELLVVPR